MASSASASLGPLLRGTLGLESGAIWGCPNPSVRSSINQPPFPAPAAQQALLGWMIKSPSPVRQEVIYQLVGPIQYPLLRRSLRRLRSTQELDAFLRPVLVPDNHARGFERWHNNARFQAWVRREFLLRAAQERQAQRRQEGSFLEPPWLAGGKEETLPGWQEVVDWFGLHDWNRKVRDEVSSRALFMVPQSVHPKGNDDNHTSIDPISRAPRGGRTSGGWSSFGSWRGR